MNKCHFMGRLVRDPEIRYTQSEFAESKRAAEGEPASNDFMQIPDGEQGELPFN